MRQKFTTKEKRWCLVPCVKLINLGKKHISDFQKTRKFLNNFTFFHIDINPFLLAGPLHCNCIFNSKAKQCLKFGKDLFSRVFYKFYFSLRRSGCHPPRVVWPRLVRSTTTLNVLGVWVVGIRGGFVILAPLYLHKNIQGCCAGHRFNLKNRNL